MLWNTNNGTGVSCYLHSSISDRFYLTDAVTVPANSSEKNQIEPRQKSVYKSKSNSLYWTCIINTCWSILPLPDLGRHYLSASSCGVFPYIMDWRNRWDVATQVLIIDHGNGQAESKSTILPVYFSGRVPNTEKQRIFNIPGQYMDC